MAFSSKDSSLKDDPYFSIYRESEFSLSDFCECAACSFSIFFRFHKLLPYNINKEKCYPKIQCQQLSKLNDYFVSLICQVLLNVELTDENLEDWQFNTFECHEDLMEFAETTHNAIARYEEEKIYYDMYFKDQAPLDVIPQCFKRYSFNITTESNDLEDSDVISAIESENNNESVQVDIILAEFNPQNIVVSENSIDLIEDDNISPTITQVVVDNDEVNLQLDSKGNKDNLLIHQHGFVAPNVFPVRVKILRTLLAISLVDEWFERIAELVWRTIHIRVNLRAYSSYRHKTKCFCY